MIMDMLLASGLILNHVYTLDSIRHLSESDRTVQVVFNTLDPDIISNLGEFGIKIIFKDSYSTRTKCNVYASYSPSNHLIEMYCKDEVSPLLAELAHAIDQMNGKGIFKSEIDLEFNKISNEYNLKVASYLEGRGLKFEDVFNRKFNYFPGYYDSIPILGPQGYYKKKELFMEGTIFYFYNPSKLQYYYPELYFYIKRSLEESKQRFILNRYFPTLQRIIEYFYGGILE